MEFGPERVVSDEYNSCEGRLIDQDTPTRRPISNQRRQIPIDIQRKLKSPEEVKEKEIDEYNNIYQGSISKKALSKILSEEDSLSLGGESFNLPKFKAAAVVPTSIFHKKVMSERHKLEENPEASQVELNFNLS
jgi:hypothetical protein